MALTSSSMKVFQFLDDVELLHLEAKSRISLSRRGLTRPIFR
jgi:hypothetical protein